MDYVYLTVLSFFVLRWKYFSIRGKAIANICASFGFINLVVNIFYTQMKLVETNKIKPDNENMRVYMTINLIIC